MGADLAQQDKGTFLSTSGVGYGDLTPLMAAFQFISEMRLLSYDLLSWPPVHLVTLLRVYSPTKGD
jgi:hypothetical protein